MTYYKKCLACGKPFRPYKNQKYCSENCKNTKEKLSKVNLAEGLSKTEIEKLKQKSHIEGINDYN